MSCGGVVEWTKAPVLKTGVVQATVGSNPTPSAIQSPAHWGSLRASLNSLRYSNLRSLIKRYSFSLGDEDPSSSSHLWGHSLWPLFPVRCHIFPDTGEKFCPKGICSGRFKQIDGEKSEFRETRIQTTYAVWTIQEEWDGETVRASCRLVGSR